MDEQKFEELAKRWPDLFQKSAADSFSIGNGWYSIVDTFCKLISIRVDNSKSNLKFAIENPDTAFVQSLDELEKNVVDSINELPVISQITERYGALRIYMQGGNDVMHRHIEFAEAMSLSMCNICGNVGRHRTGAVAKILCNDCHREHNPEELPNELPTRRVKPKLAEE